MHQLMQFHLTLPFHTESSLTAGEESAKEAWAMTENIGQPLDSKKKKETKTDKTVVKYSLVNYLYINQLLLNINKYLVKVCCVVLV